tara:strand:+ start:32 stop:667 length:636 start_codon:yes stop_codon:yes gene_type:complete
MDQYTVIKRHVIRPFLAALVELTGLATPFLVQKSFKEILESCDEEIYLPLLISQRNFCEVLDDFFDTAQSFRNSSTSDAEKEILVVQSVIHLMLEVAVTASFFETGFNPRIALKKHVLLSQASLAAAETDIESALMRWRYLEDLLLRLSSEPAILSCIRRIISEVEASGDIEFCVFVAIDSLNPNRRLQHEFIQSVSNSDYQIHHGKYWGV